MPNLRPVRTIAFIALAGTALALLPAATRAATEAEAPAAAKAPSADELRQQEIELKNAIRANPGDPTNHVKLGHIYLDTGNLPAAEAEAREARKDGGDEDDTAPLLAEALLDEHKPEQLLDLLQPADREPQSESIVRFSLAMAHLALKETGQAEPLLKDAVRLDPDAWRPKLGLAQLLLTRHDLNGAAKLLDEANAIDPGEIEIMRARGELLRVQGNTAGAVAEFSKVLAKQPNDFAALLSRANAFLELDKLDDAKRDIDAALKITPKSPPAGYLSALILARQGKLNDADAKLIAISPAFDRLISGYYLAGAVKYALGQYDLADQDLAKYLAQQPGQPAALRLRALISLRRGDPKRAIELLKPVVDANPADASSLAVLAQAYVAEHRNDEALALYEHAAEISPDNTKMQTDAARMQLSFGDTAAAAAELEKIADSTGGTDVAAPLLVIAELQRGEVDKAAQKTDALAKMYPDNPVVQNIMGSVEIAEQSLPKAQATLEALTKAHPDFLAARRNLAQVLLAERKPDDAKTVLLALLQQAPKDEQTLLTLADIAQREKNTAEAADRLQAAEAAAPRDPTPGIRLIELYAGQKNWDQAGAAMRSLKEAFPDDERVIALSGDLHAQQNDFAGAEVAYQDLIRRSPDQPALYLRLAGLQMRAGEKEGARATLAKAQALQPENRSLMADLVSFDDQQRGPDAALATVKSVAKNDPEAAALLSADVLMSAKRNDQALATLQAAQKQNPTSAIEAQIGELLYAGGKTQAARSELADWVKSHDKDVACRLVLAGFDMLEKNDGAARGLYETVQKLAPGNVTALNNLAVLYARVNDPRAATLAAEAYRRAPGATTGDTLGWILVTSGKAAEGLPYLRDASTAAPQDGAVQYHLAVALNAVGQKDDARKVLEQVMSQDRPFDEKTDAQRLLETLQHG